MLVSSDKNETRVAILESSRVVQLYFDRKIKKSLVGNIYMGKVKNVLPSLDAAFVDIGVHQDGLVHISQLADKFVKHPLDVVKVGDIVEVSVLEVDEKRKRISLSMKNQ